ncbi:MAG: glutamate synthase central domain-containing protein, partial [Candidatus Omnitrophica bacterium]|nr:glutamate synthase central domain-containing protein [Candidatus Omnitrophota bacterium]
MKKLNGFPEKQGLYDPEFEHDSCGVGFVCDIKGRKSHRIIADGLEVLARLAHRGATGADPATGDGAGILIQMPHKFLKHVCQEAGISLPDQGGYGAGLVFLPQDEKYREFCKDVFLEKAHREGLRILGWRQVPVDHSGIGKLARKTQPAIEQVFISSGSGIKEEIDFERRLYLVRKQVENTVGALGLREKSSFYITNLSCRMLSYKGLLMPQQVEGFFPDLKDPYLESSLCLVHSRYSTNTFPTWDLAQPFRFLAHNGEINTLRGNINWMRAREGLLESEVFGKELKKLFPVIVPGGSDSAAIDNVFELLVLSGRPLDQAMMMLIPAAWEQNTLLGERARDFYKYHACCLEPWDGPAAIAFTDGTKIGALLDRNGLRPARYLVTKNDLVVMASEAGVLDIPARDILISGRLEPGKMFFIDTAQGRIIDDAEIKEKAGSDKPYSDWLKDNMLELEGLPGAELRGKDADISALPLMKAFGYTREDLKFIIKPMVENGAEPVGSMGNDTP